jgi:hypothetical protein
MQELRVDIAGDDAAYRDVSARLLSTEGVAAAVLEGKRLCVEYDLREVGCAQLIDTIQTAGLVLHLNWRERWLLGLRCYREGILRDDMNNEIGWDSFVREIYVSRYRHRRHGRRDDRPRHWRQYDARRAGGK